MNSLISQLTATCSAGLVLPVLGALPDALIISVSGLAASDAADLQQSVAVGIGTLAGSTVRTCIAANQPGMQQSLQAMINANMIFFPRIEPSKYFSGCRRQCLYGFIA